MTYSFNIQRRHVSTALFALSLMGALPMASAQAWPTKPVTLVVGTPAGGAIDAYARNLTDHLSRQTGGNFLVDNRAGAGATSVQCMC